MIIEVFFSKKTQHAMAALDRRRTLSRPQHDEYATVLMPALRQTPQKQFIKIEHLFKS